MHAGDYSGSGGEKREDREGRMENSDFKFQNSENRRFSVFCLLPSAFFLLTSDF
jgi:hypothetical protein